MVPQTEKRWIIAAAISWAIVLSAAIGVVLYVHRHSAAILSHLVSTDPAPARRALYCRLEADRLVHEAFLLHEAATSKTAGTQTPAQDATGALVPDAAPLLERAEQLYLASLDAMTSQPGVLFRLGEVSFLRGQRARGFLYLARYWDAVGEKSLSRAYRRLAIETDPSATIPLRDDAATSGSTN
jgi:hypothetical protein